jgi:hypothetical protein|tara:strand:- start:125 stop:1099 length:975 start_codon:yes stop_codon:yes gene_type:complete
MADITPDTINQEDFIAAAEANIAATGQDEGTVERQSEAVNAWGDEAGMMKALMSEHMSEPVPSPKTEQDKALDGALKAIGVDQQPLKNELHSLMSELSGKTANFGTKYPLVEAFLTDNPEDTASIVSAGEGEAFAGTTFSPGSSMETQTRADFERAFGVRFENTPKVVVHPESITTVDGSPKTPAHEFTHASIKLIEKDLEADIHTVLDPVEAKSPEAPGGFSRMYEEDYVRLFDLFRFGSADAGVEQSVRDWFLRSRTVPLVEGNSKGEIIVTDPWVLLDNPSVQRNMMRLQKLAEVTSGKKGRTHYPENILEVANKTTTINE